MICPDSKIIPIFSRVHSPHIICISTNGSLRHPFDGFPKPAGLSQVRPTGFRVHEAERSLAEQLPVPGSVAIHPRSGRCILSSP